MKAKKMIVPILMGVLMAFAILPMTAGTAHAEDYELYVGDTQVTSVNASDILGDRTAGYDAESKTLTLNGVTIPEDNTTGILSKIPDLKIEVHGENKLSGQDIGIYSLQNLTITGEGSLEAEGLRYGIYLDGDITITDATVSATATDSVGIGIEATGEIKIEGRSKVQAKGSYYAIVCDSGITLGGGHAITEPVNGRISDDGYYIVDQAGQKAASVTIERVVKMSGDGTEESPYQIKKYADLKEFASIVNGKHQAPQNTAACGKLMSDITCDDKKWEPISDDGTYAGTFDGNHKVIYDLSNEETGAGKNNQGLFGKIVKGEVKNVGIVGGKIIGKDYVGAVVGQIIGTMTNCYNTGSVSGLGYVGGVAGTLAQGPGARATITNCYNTGSVSGSQGVGGLVGYNGSLIAGGTITNCYNVGSVSGSKYVGGVAGTNYGAINNCYYNKELNVVKAIGDGSAGTNVEGLETSQMVGAAALYNGNMAFNYESPSENPWLTKEGGKDADSGTYYEYYPHLKGFAYDISKKAADWPGKLTTSAEWSDDAVSYDYNGSAQGPKVTKVITSPKPVEIPDDMTAEWRSKTVDESSGDPKWGEPIYDEPSLPGVYKLTIKDPKDGDKVIEEIVYIILKKKNSSNSNDYNVKYQVQKKTAGGGTKWSDIDSKDIVDVGNYKAVIELTGRPDLEEKEFQIAKAPLTITTAPTASAITYGHKLNDSKLTGGVAKDGDAEVAGTFTWDEPDTIPAVSDSNKTEYDVTFTPTDTANYEPAACTATLTVNKAYITPSVSIEGWTYGSTSNTPTVEGNQGGGDVTFQYKKTGDPDSSYTGTVPTDAGTYTVKAEVSETRNYNGGEATLDFTISPADMQVTSAGYNGVYDGKAHSITVNAPEGAEVMYAGPGGSFTEENPAFTDAGTYAVDFRVRLENYKEYAGTETVEIAKAAITIKADDKSSKYGAALKELTYKVSGAYVEGDDLGVALSTDAKKDKAGTYAIRVSWNENPNYAATLTDGAYTVGKKPEPKPGPQPKPQPKVNKAAAKTSLDAGVIARSSGSKVTVSWGAVKGASSYVIYANYCDQKKCRKIKTVSGKTTSIDITKLAGKKFDPKKNLKFYVVAYKTVKGKKVKLAKSIMVHAPGSKNSKRTNVTGVKVKKATFTLKKGKTAKIKAKLILQKKSKKPLKHCAKFRYASSNKKVAKVSKKGKITAVGKGKCTVYVYAVSGVSKKIKVTVK